MLKSRSAPSASRFSIVQPLMTLVRRELQARQYIKTNLPSGPL